MANREQVGTFVSIIEQLLDGNRTVQFVVEGSGPDIDIDSKTVARIPASVTITAKSSSRGVLLVVSKPYITVTRKTFFGKASGNIDEISVTPERIDISLRNMRDVSIEVKE